MQGGESGQRLEHGAEPAERIRVTDGDGRAVLRECDRVRKNPPERQSAAPPTIHLPGLRPGRYGARNGIGSKGAAPRNLHETTLPVESSVHAGAGAARSVDGLRN